MMLFSFQVLHQALQHKSLPSTSYSCSFVKGKNHQGQAACHTLSTKDTLSMRCSTGTGFLTVIAIDAGIALPSTVNLASLFQTVTRFMKQPLWMC